MADNKQEYDVNTLELFINDAKEGKFAKVDTTATPYVRISVGSEYCATDAKEYYYSFDSASR